MILERRRKLAVRKCDVDMSINFNNSIVKKYMMEGYFGLEKESLRITPDGFLSRTKHPFADNPSIDRDFSESQVELITTVSDSIDDVWEELSALHKKTVRKLLHLESGREYLWPFSNPPYVRGEGDIPIARYQGKRKKKEQYREYLAQKYGKMKMLFSGIHFNFSFPDIIFEEGWKNSPFSSCQEYKNYVYLELSKKVVKYSWLIVYLTAASPVMDGSYFRKENMGKEVTQNYASPRCSEMGYWNDFVPILKYGNLEEYVKSIEGYIEQGQLREATELYYPVRLKSVGENSLDRLKQGGVNHIELRMLDLNPLVREGVCKEDLKFLHLLILYLSSLEDEDFESYKQIAAIHNQKTAAKYEEDDIWIKTTWNKSSPVREEAMKVLLSMEHFFMDHGRQEHVDVIRFQEQKVVCPEKRYAVRIKNAFRTNYVQKGIALARVYAQELEEEYERLQAAENVEKKQKLTDGESISYGG